MRNISGKFPDFVSSFLWDRAVDIIIIIMSLCNNVKLGRVNVITELIWKALKCKTLGGRGI